jgi:tRNA dimethylallyltransferase
MIRLLRQTAFAMAERQILKPKVLVISGTTAVGKTDLSIAVAKRLNGEIISADSAQVFKGMDVGTAKIGKQEQREVPHHLLDVVDVTETFTAGDFRDKAYEIIEGIHASGRLPIVVGGTSFYIKTFLEGCGNTAPPSTPDGQSRVDSIIRGKSWEESLEYLSGMDKEYAQSLSWGDWYRLRRAVEICIVTGKPVTSFKKKVELEELPFEPKCLFLTMPRGMLYKRIEARCEVIIQNGLFEEVVDLVENRGLVAESQAGRCIGYRQTLEYLKEVWDFPKGRDGDIFHPEVNIRSEISHRMFTDFVLHYKASTRQLAHSQLTWHKKEDYFCWLNMAPGGNILSVDSVCTAVTDWLDTDKDFPPEMNGNALKHLSKQEQRAMKTAKTDVHLDVDQSLIQLQQLLLSKHKPENT